MGSVGALREGIVDPVIHQGINLVGSHHNVVFKEPGQWLGQLALDESQNDIQLNQFPVVLMVGLEANCVHDGGH